MWIKSLTGLVLGVFTGGLLFLSHGCSGGDGSNTGRTTIPNSTIPRNVVLVVMLQPTQVVIPTQVVVGDQAQALPPIRCTGGRVRLSDAEQRDVTLDGGGDDCLRAEGTCTIDLTFRSVTLTNCQRCLRAEGNSSIHLTTTGAIHCTAAEDGIRAEGTRQVRLDAGSRLTLEAAEHGIRAAGPALILLDDPALLIHR